VPEESAGHRHARLQELILEELRGLFRDDVSDPALADVTVTNLALSVDYRHARVHFVLQDAGTANVRLVHARLARVTPFLRARLGDSLDLKRTPELSFVLDAITGPRGPRSEE
jgi:ribosome-binding factor A